MASVGCVRHKQRGTRRRRRNDADESRIPMFLLVSCSPTSVDRLSENCPMWLGVVGVLGGTRQGGLLGQCDAGALHALVALQRLSVLIPGEATVAFSEAVPLE